MKLLCGDSQTQTTVASLIRECTSASQVREETLGFFNVAMAQRRLQASEAPTNNFHTYLRLLCESDNLVRCLTTNLEGMEGRDCPEVEARLMMTRGDNRFVRCLSRDCPGLTSPDFEHLLVQLSTGQTVNCPLCYPKG